MMDLYYTQRGTRGPPRNSQITNGLLPATNIFFGDVRLAAAFVAVITDAAKTVWQF